MREPFLSAVPVLQKLKDSGYEAFFVGGSVRDYLLGKQISDVDIATSATPEEVKGIFSKTVDVGIEHGTVLVLYHHKQYEITTFRTDGEYQDFRRPKEVEFIRSLTEDLKRRDFTMNAIAMDCEGKLIDPFDGQIAIKEKVIRTVGLAKERFQEDALRMMRAVRFVSQLGFRIEEKTRLALSELSHLLEKIAIERKRAEFEKMLIGENWRNATKLLLEAGLHKYLPGLNNRQGQLEKLLSFNFQQLDLKDMWALLIFCLALSDSQIEGFLRNWRLPIKEIKDIRNSVFFLRKRLQTDWAVCDLYMAGKDTIQSVEKLYLVIKGIADMESVNDRLREYDALPIKQRTDLMVSGNEIMNWLDREGGPWLKDLLLNLEKTILEGKIPNDKLKIKEWLETCSQK